MPDENRVATLKKQRKSIKALCTRIKTYVDSITNVNPSITAQLEERRLKMDHYWSEYSRLQSQIEIADESDNDRAAFEEAFYVLSSKIREILRGSSPVPVAASPILSNEREITDAVTHVRLPKLNLPTFSGKYEEWFPFLDTFNSVIHFNASLSRSQKFQYLRSSLTGTALDVINSLEISDNDYDIAWTLLRERYDNKRAIVQNYIRAIMELPSMTKENLAELRQITDGASKHLRALQALQLPTNHWDALLIYVLSFKLDTFTLREWRSSLSGSDLPTLKQFFDFINHQCQTLEDTGTACTVASKSGNSRSQPNPKRQQANVATVKVKCTYCRGEHSIYYCKDFLALPISRRISEVHTRKICTNCLRSSSHKSTQCSSGSCKVCQAKHNTLLHQSSESAESSSNSASKASDSKNNPSTVQVTNASGLISGNGIMLSTASILAHDSKGECKPCRALLDCCSQASFISRRFLSNLGLKPRSLNVSVSGIGGTTTTSAQAVHVRFQSRLGSYSATVQCIVTDQVTDKLPAYSLKRGTFVLPRNIKLADPNYHVSSDIDLLISAELFWDLLCVGQIKATPEYPTLQKTQLGWILAGRTSRVAGFTPNVHSFHASITNSLLHDQLARFWQIDDGLDE